MDFLTRSPLLLLLIGVFSIALNQATPTPPPGAIGPYINGIFPASTPGAGGAWELVDPLPGQTFYGPIRIIPFTGTDDILVLGKDGEVWRVNLANQFSELVLDFTDRSFAKGDAGAVGIALHPEFGNPDQPDKQVVFVYYRTKPDPEPWDEKGYNRLSKFKWDADTETFDTNSEEVLIQQYDRSTWHNGGDMFFGDDGFLYFSVGDEGVAEYQAVSTQRLDGGLFSGVFRIDIDNDPAKSHPIIRQPVPNADPPADWPGTFTQGYSIPNDNPWLSPDGSYLEEYYAIGTRSPYSMTLDRESGIIWIADVGDADREEITQVVEGDNLQWPYMEGTLPYEGFVRPENLIGKEKPPYIDYDRTYGTCVVGGSVYRGNKFPELTGKYLFGDFTTNRLLSLSSTSENIVPEIETLIANMGGEAVDIPQGAGVTGVYPMPNGDILITIIGSRMEAIPGKIYKLKRSAQVPDPPTKLSDLGVFVDLVSLEPVPGIIPYEVNAPLWSDRAEKKRWMALPNDGNFDTPEEKITFNRSRDWEFPEGTVFIKQFDLPTSLGENSDVVRLETRFFVIGTDNKAYGLTYKWNEEGTEAFLQGGASSKAFDIFDEDGQYAYTQSWDYPGREQCMTCHTANANYVLGVKTHQLNGSAAYAPMGVVKNQLDYLNDLNAFNYDIGDPQSYSKAYSIDDESADLGLRIRSYLDSNCSSCHRLGGLPTVSMDLQFYTPFSLKNIISFTTQSHSSNPNRRIVEPGFHASSELWLRDASMNANRMPPLSRNLIDEVYIEKLAEWIDGLAADEGVLKENLIYPNPSDGWFNIRVRDDWEGPFQLKIIATDGRIIHRETSDSRSTHLDFSIMPSGLYILEIVAGDNRIVEHLIVQ